MTACVEDIEGLAAAFSAAQLKSRLI